MKYGVIAFLLLCSVACYGQKDSDYVDACIKKLDDGIEKSMKGDHAGAIVDFTNAIDIEAKEVDSIARNGISIYHLLAYSQRGIAKLATGDTTGALKDCTIAIEQALSNTRLIFYRDWGFTAVRNRDVYRAGETKNVLFANRGRVRYALREYIGVIADCNQAIFDNEEGGDLSNTNSRIIQFCLYYRGLAKAGLGDDEGAEGDFSSATRSIRNYDNNGILIKLWKFIDANNYLHKGLSKTKLQQYDNNSGYSDYCKDFSKAGEMGLTLAYEMIRKYCKRSNSSGAQSPAPPESPQPSSTEQTTPKDVQKASGTGFVVSSNGLIITNYHVVEGASKIEVFFPKHNITKTATIKIKDVKNDIVVLEAANFNFADISSKPIPFTFASLSSIKVGQEVFTLGFPLGDIMGATARLATGSINSLFGLQDDPRVYQINNAIQPGNSGGALFNKKGELVGICVSGLNAKYFYENAGIIPQNVNFAIKSSYLSNLLSMMPEGDEILTRKNTVVQTTLEAQIEQLIPFIVQIRVY